MKIKNFVLDMAVEAKKAAKTVAVLSTDIKNDALLNMAQGLIKNSQPIRKENAKDLKDANVLLAELDRLNRLLYIQSWFSRCRRHTSDNEEQDGDKPNDESSFSADQRCE